MMWLRSLWRRARAVVRAERINREIEEELMFHIEARTEENIRRGMSPAEARRDAEKRFGHFGRIKERGYEVRGGRWLESFWQDLRFAWRILWKSPGFTLVALLTLALGIGANSSIFSVINAAVLRPLPYPRPEQLVLLFERDVMAEGSGPNVVSLPNFLDWQAESRSFTAMAAVRANSFNLGGTGTIPERVEGAICSWSLFPALSVRPLIGRAFNAAEDKPGSPQVAVISYGLWQRRFGGAPDILKRFVRLDAENYEVVGVMPPDFNYPYRGIDVWTPVQRVLDAESRQDRTSHQFYVVARLRPGVRREQALAELDAIAHRNWAEHPGEVIGRGASILPLAEASAYNSRTALLVLFAAVSCLLLVACVNIANLLLARILRRRRETAVRAALGAGHGRIFRQFLTESILLAVLGAACGLVLAYGLTNFFAAHAPALLNQQDIDTSAEIRLDWWVFLFTAGVALLAGLCTGVVPAWQVMRTDVTANLKEGGSAANTSPAQRRFRNALVVGEVALSLVLLVAAGLFVRSFEKLRGVNPGTRLDHLLTIGLSLPDAKYAKPEQISIFAQQLLERLKALPGVRTAGLVSCLPVAGYCGDSSFQIEGRPLPSGQFSFALMRGASPDYFATADISLLRGRTFTAQDGREFDEQHSHDDVVIISEAMAEKFWPGGDALDQRIYFGDPSHLYRIIGIVGDVLIGLDEKPRPTLYQPLLGGGWSDFYAVIQTEGDPSALASVASRELNDLDSDIPAFKIRTMADLLHQSAAQRQFTTLLLGSFAALALLLAAVGLYGVLSYVVAQRTREIGIRMALGATQSQVSRLVLFEGLRPALVGIALGLAGAAVLTRLLRSLLFGVEPTDTATFVLMPALLLLVALLACYFPARRATKVDPMVALRYE